MARRLFSRRSFVSRCPPPLVFQRGQLQRLCALPRGFMLLERACRHRLSASELHEVVFETLHLHGLPRVCSVNVSTRCLVSPAGFNAGFGGFHVFLPTPMKPGDKTLALIDRLLRVPQGAVQHGEFLLLPADVVDSSPRRALEAVQRGTHGSSRLFPSSPERSRGSIREPRAPASAPDGGFQLRRLFVLSAFLPLLDHEPGQRQGVDKFRKLQPFRLDDRVGRGRRQPPFRADSSRGRSCPRRSGPKSR